jgi:flagellar hook-associated protein 3 FlgL
VADSHPGSDVFMNVVQGNGTFVTGAAAANTGSGVIDGGSVTNKATWAANVDTYTIKFTSATTYDVLDSTSTVVTTGTYAANDTISFNGVQVQLQGAPATGDEFTVAPSGRQDMFATISNLLTSLARPSDSDAQNAQFATEMGTALAQLDRSLDQIGGVRAQVGARLSVLSDAADAQADREVELKTSLSGLRDLDYADAIARLNIQLASLQAAQQSYARINQLSLFNYL